MTPSSPSKSKKVTRYSQWEIWQVNWQHEDGTVKDRPALLLSSSAYNEKHDELWFAKISTKEYKTNIMCELAPGDPSFASTGLNKRCWIYFANARKIDKKDILKLRGRLDTFSAVMMGVLMKQALKFKMP